MVITPRGEKARCPVLTGRDEQDGTTWCGALRDAVTYGTAGSTLDQDRRENSCATPAMRVGGRTFRTNG